MNNLLKVVSTGIVGAIVAFLAIILSGLGTTVYANSEGTWVTLNTLQIGGTEFIVLMVLAVFLAVTITGYLLNAANKK